MVFSQLHISCNISSMLHFTAKYQAIFSLLSVANNLYFYLLCCYILFAHSHISCNRLSLPHFTAKFQAVFPILSVANKLFFISSIGRLS